MNKMIYFIMSVFTALTMTLGGFYNVGASSNSSPQLAVITYYVSVAGSDTNNCTQQTTPCKSFDKAQSLALAGDIIHIIGTIPSIRVTKDGIIVEGGVVDGIANKTQNSPALGVAANNVTIRNIEVVNGWSYGIRTDAGYGYLTLDNVTIHNSVLENRLSTGGCNTSSTSGWGSGFRAYLSTNVVMRNSKIYDNCGEGFSSVMSSNVTGTNLEVYDNFSVNIYPDQSQNFTVTDSVISCIKPEYQRFSKSVSLLLGAERYSGITTNTTNGIVFERNKIYNCKGVQIYSTTTNVWNNVRVVNNEFYNVPSPAIASIPGINIVTSPNVISSDPSGTTPVPTLIAAPTNTQLPATATMTATTIPVGSPTTSPTFYSTAVAPTKTQTPVPTSAETYYDNSNAAFVYSANWTKITKSPAYGGSYHETTKNDSSVIFTFTGQSFSILYTGGSAFRNMKVYVDNVLVGTINQKLSTRTYKVRWDYTGQLAPGTHTLKLVFATTNATGTKGSIDAVIVR